MYALCAIEIITNDIEVGSHNPTVSLIVGMKGLNCK